MKMNWLLKFLIVMGLAAPALAEENPYKRQNNTPHLQTVAPQEQQEDPFLKYINYIQKEWARIKYQVPGKDSKLAAIHKLEDYAAKISAAYPNRPEALIWEGIVLSTDAGIVKGMSALGKVKDAKKLFEKALEIDPSALDGSAYTSLGSLYYQVPGWPVAFGDSEKAEENLKKALSINPGGIDPNFFYGDYLLHEKRYGEARFYLTQALKAPDRPDRALADAGRRQEIKAALAEIENNKFTGDTGAYNH